MSRAYSLLFFLVLFLSAGCGGDDGPMIEEEEPPFEYEGKWLGRWSDSIFSFINVSAEVTSVGNNRYTGKFYYNTEGNAAYTPCCGGTTNGNFTFTREGDQILDFEYVQVAPEYRDGCPGIYSGEGSFNEGLNRLVMTFTGTDCDGFHDDGRIAWEFDE
jgi:hypothetical protein